VVVGASVVVVGVSVVVVGASVVVVVVPPAHPVSVHASQQLGKEPTHAVPFFGGLHFVASFLMLQVVFGRPFLIVVLQHVTDPGLPHVDFAAHWTTAPLQFFGRVFALARSFAIAAAHFT
jgi:hypothetical protein